MREIKSTKRANATQRSVRNRNQRKKVDEEAQQNASQRSAEMQEREITEIKSMKRTNATQRNAAWQCEKEKSEKEGRRRASMESNAART